MNRSLTPGLCRDPYLCWKKPHKAATLFPACALLPAAIVGFGAYRTVRAARDTLDTLEGRFAEAADQRKTWSGLHVMQDVLLRDAGGKVRDELAELLVTDDGGTVVAATRPENVGNDLGRRGPRGCGSRRTTSAPAARARAACAASRPTKPRSTAASCATLAPPRTAGRSCARSPGPAPAPASRPRPRGSRPGIACESLFYRAAPSSVVRSDGGGGCGRWRIVSGT